MMLHPEIPKFVGLMQAATLTSFVTALGAGIRHVARIRRHHRDIGKLQQMDDRALRDIGLTRADLHGAASAPFWRDPGPLLLHSAGPRKRGAQARVEAPSIVPVIAGGLHSSKLPATSPH
jgi:uncharacterized protein YjiS (DUF1127 family)